MRGRQFAADFLCFVDVLVLFRSCWRAGRKGGTLRHEGEGGTCGVVPTSSRAGVTGEGEGGL